MLLDAIKRKIDVISDADEMVLGLLDEADIEGDIEEVSEFELKYRKDIREIEKYITLAKELGSKDVVDGHGGRGIADETRSQTGVKLPKIIIKKGDTWRTLASLLDLIQRRTG